MYTLLTTTRKLTLSAYKHETNVEERRDRSLAKIKVWRDKGTFLVNDPWTPDNFSTLCHYNVRTSLFCFQCGRIKVQAEISEFKDKLELAKETIAKFKSEISKVQREGLVTSEPNAQTNHHSPSIGGVFGSS